MKNKIFGVLIALVLAVTGFGLVGCGGNKETPAPQPGPGPVVPEVSYDDDTTPVAIEETGLVFADAYNPYERGLRGSGDTLEEEPEFDGAKCVTGLVEAVAEIVIPAYVIDEDENVYKVTQIAGYGLNVKEEEDVELLGDVEDEESPIELVKVTIPSTVTYVDDYAFSGCTALQEIVLNNRITVIDNLYYAFDTLFGEFIEGGYTREEVFALLNIDDESEGLYYLGNPGNPYMYLVSAGESYWPQEELEEGHELVANIHANCKVIGYGAFESSVVTEVVLPNGLKAIGSSAFGGCDYLEYIEIPTSVEFMGNWFANYSTYLYIDHDLVEYLPYCGADVIYVLKTLVDDAEEGVYPFDGYSLDMTYDEEAEEDVEIIETHNNKEYYVFYCPVVE